MRSSQGQSSVPFANGVITRTTQALKLVGLELGDPCKVYAQEKSKKYVSPFLKGILFVFEIIEIEQFKSSF